MSNHILSVCIFCFVCATHSPCASHAAIGHLEQHRHDGYKDPNIPIIEENHELSFREKRHSNHRPDSPPDANQSAQQHHHYKRNWVTKSMRENEGDNFFPGESDFLRRIFLKFGDGEKMTADGLGKLLKKLDLMQILSERLKMHGDEDFLHVDVRKEAREVDQNDTCFNKETIIALQQSTESQPLNHSTFSEICPLLVYSLLSETCSIKEKGEFEVSASQFSGVDAKIWMYSSLAVLLISVCGVGALVIIPLMQKRFYKPLIQFLVALAVGTLAGDALLHLLPHAMSESHSPTEDHDPHIENTWKGLVAMMGLTFFFVMERLIFVAGKWRKNKQKHKTDTHTHVQIYNDEGERRNSTQCMDKYNDSPFCYKDILPDRNSKTDLQLKHSRSLPFEKLDTHQPDGDTISTPCIEEKMLTRDHEDIRVIVREHATDHHGHSHKHGHVHSAPQNYSSVAWMVIMGDGLHNFTDGMAIGVAFASGIAGGFSTTVAVFCHELPHELGDFAMLLKAGMSIKQALFYNLLSSGLCILGNFVGLYLGNTESANQWVFAAAAGTFIYIALVDMIPELSSAHEDEENLIQYFLHLSGLLIGVGIMTLIALYEHDLKNLFHESE
ncbi:zinc transporter foi-like [Euwallacea fornicatus]|uniref:zinc transporter foi-like n=1 Tax=Euwallacea fornicatus TaxID=995702 RepID=UPI00338D4B9B